MAEISNSSPNNDNSMTIDEDESNDINHESMSQFLLRLTEEHKKEIYELSREIGYSLANKSNFPYFRLKSALVKLVQLPSDSKIYEVLSIHINKNNKNISMNHNNLKHQYNSLYSGIMYYYLNIAINDKQSIHVRIYGVDEDQTVQAILYKNINDKLRVY